MYKRQVLGPVPPAIPPDLRLPTDLQLKAGGGPEVSSAESAQHQVEALYHAAVGAALREAIEKGLVPAPKLSTAELQRKIMEGGEPIHPFQY